MIIDMGMARAVGLALFVIGGIVVAVKAAKHRKITWHAADIFALVVIAIGLMLMMGLVKTDAATTATDRLRSNMREQMKSTSEEEMPPLKETKVVPFSDQINSLRIEGEKQLNARRKLITQ